MYLGGAYFVCADVRRVRMLGEEKRPPGAPWTSTVICLTSYFGKAHTRARSVGLIYAKGLAGCLARIRPKALNFDHSLQHRNGSMSETIFSISARHNDPAYPRSVSIYRWRCFTARRFCIPATGQSVPARICETCWAWHCRRKNF